MSKDNRRITINYGPLKTTHRIAGEERKGNIVVHRDPTVHDENPNTPVGFDTEVQEWLRETEDLVKTLSLIHI